MNKGFLNPYNFIPLPKERSKKYDQSENDYHSGVIEYRITTRTPLFIPNTSTDDAFRLKTNEIDKKTGKEKGEDHISQDFYSYEELSDEGGDEVNGYQEKKYCQEPVIPGSEIRGMVRNIYETVTGSCMSTLNGDEYPIKRTDETFKPALIYKKDDQYKLFMAIDFCYPDKSTGKTFKDINYTEGQCLHFYYNEDDLKELKDNQKPIITEECHDKKSGKDNQTGYLIKGMDSPSSTKNNKKHYAHIFVKDDSQNCIKITRKDLNRLSDVLDSYQEFGGEGSYKEYKQRFDSFRNDNKNAYFPVYCSVLRNDDKKVKVIYLSPACYTKERSVHSVNDLAGDFKPCIKMTDCCPACDLFGMISGSNKESKSSKIRFADARVENLKSNNYEYYDPIVTLQALGGPKLSNVEFYLKRPVINGKKADFWTYDYCVCNGKVYFSKATLRGRKYYWHQSNMNLPSNIVRTKQNKTIRPLKKDISFIGKMYYDDISEKQLNQLLWILNGGKSEIKDGLMYKLGTGKPLGLGSVELSVISNTERVFKNQNDKIQYNENTFALKDMDIPNYEELGFDKNCKTNFITISSFHSTDGLNVTYPVTQDQVGRLLEEGFKWFEENHAVYTWNKRKRKYTKKMLNKRTQMKINYELPQLLDYKNLLPYDASNKKRGS